MEPITLCGLVIVIFGLWEEFAPSVRRAVKVIHSSRFYQSVISQATAQKPVYVTRMPDGASAR